MARPTTSKLPCHWLSLYPALSATRTRSAISPDSWAPSGVRSLFSGLMESGQIDVFRRYQMVLLHQIQSCSITFHHRMVAGTGNQFHNWFPWNVTCHNAFEGKLKKPATPGKCDNCDIEMKSGIVRTTMASLDKFLVWNLRLQWIWRVLLSRTYWVRKTQLWICCEISGFPRTREEDIGIEIWSLSYSHKNRWKPEVFGTKVYTKLIRGVDLTTVYHLNRVWAREKCIFRAFVRFFFGRKFPDHPEVVGWSSQINFA